MQVTVLDEVWMKSPQHTYLPVNTAYISSGCETRGTQVI